jgi:uncharacterized protein (DUF58 family)
MSGPDALDLAELMGIKPRRVSAPVTPGQRIPGGERRGIVRVQGTEFDSVTPYNLGDDVRRIDWAATARTGKTHVRRSAAVAHRARCVVVRLSDELFFGTSGRVLAKTAALAVAWKCWEALALNEPVGLVLGNAPELAMPRRGKRHIERLLEALWLEYQRTLQQAAPSRTAPLMELVYSAAERLNRRDQISVIDEFSGLDVEFQRSSSTLAEQRSLQAIVLEDPMFRQPLPVGTYAFQSGRDGRAQTLVLDSKAARTASDELSTFRRSHRGTLMGCGWHVTDAVDLLPAPGKPFGDVG